MEVVKTYKCPCCDAPLVYDGSGKTLQCDSCGNEFKLSNLRDLDRAETEAKSESKYDWSKYTPREFKDSGKIKLSGYTCPSCGAQITGDDNVGAVVCPYCGNGNIIHSQFEGSLRPDYIIPFKINKNAAMSAFEENFEKAPFLPDEFKSRKKIEEMSGIYVPFWMFDCDCDANIIYSAERSRSWSDSDYDYVETDYYKLFRSGTVGFENIPVDGSAKIDNKYTESAEPFDYNDAADFDTAYLSGYLADRYDVDAEECEKRANERVKNSTEEAFRRTTDTYSMVTVDSSNVSFENGKVRYALLPMWILNIKYIDKMYKFAINGQTGKVVGEYPIDKKKQWKFFAKVAGITYIITIILAIILLCF